VAKGADICVPFKSLGVSIGKKTNMDKRINYKLTLIFWTLTKGRPKKTTYFSGAGAAIIVSNLDSKRSVNKINSWVESINEYIGNIPLFFVGTSKSSDNPKYLDQFTEIADEYNSRYFILSQARENSLKPILKSIAKSLAKFYSKYLDNY
jgi:hypothetical protein